MSEEEALNASREASSSPGYLQGWQQEPKTLKWHKRIQIKYRIKPQPNTNKNEELKKKDTTNKPEYKNLKSNLKHNVKVQKWDELNTNIKLNKT